MDVSAALWQAGVSSLLQVFHNSTPIQREDLFLITTLISPAADLADLVSTEPPEWTSEPQSQLSMIGSNVVVKCSASGMPEPTIAWRVNGVLLQGGSHHSLTLGFILRFNAVCEIDKQSWMHGFGLLIKDFSFLNL